MYRYMLQSSFSRCSLFPHSPGVNFGQWFIFATPTMIVCLVVSWAYLSILFCDDRWDWVYISCHCGIYVL